MQKTMKAFLLNAILIVVSLCVTVLLAEGMVRMLHVSIPLTLSDRELGVIYRPFAHQVGGSSESGRTIIVDINSFGFRDDSWSADASSNILVVGDSFVTAFEVAKEERFTELLEQKLTASSTQAWQVLNAGIAGSGPDIYLDRMQKFEPLFNPEYTVVVIYNGNDLQNINYDLTPGGGRKNYVVRDNKVIAYNDIAGAKERLKWEFKLLLSHSYLVQLINDRLTKAKYVASSAAQDPVVLPEYCTVPTKDLDNSFTILTALLTQMDALSHHKLIVVSVPDKQQLRSDIPASCDPYLVESYLKAQTTALQVPFIALYDSFKPLHEELYYSGHLNPLGHQITADAIYKKIQELQNATPS
jgi:hypothetical protein